MNCLTALTKRLIKAKMDKSLPNPRGTLYESRELLWLLIMFLRLVIVIIIYCTYLFPFKILNYLVIRT